MNIPPVLINANNLDVLRFWPENSFDSIVTDPPYGLSFMGKKWDYDVPSVEIWEMCLRVLKPGGHLLSFSGTRTHHRMTVNIEDAGFEIRDMIAWVYGSGFPKSLDVSKAIDKHGGYPQLSIQIGMAIKEAREKRGLTVSWCDQEFCGGTTNWSWFEGRPNGQRIPSPETFSNICASWPELVPLAAIVNKVDRQVVGKTWSGIGNRVKEHYTVGGTQCEEVDITAPATDAARQWEGWGTALKPALEPITLARKPFKQTVAANVLEWGTGGLNIDGCRVGTEDKLGGGAEKHEQSDKPDGWDRPWRHNLDAQRAHAERIRDNVERAQSLGRWPANLIHDGSDEVVEIFPESKVSGAAKSGNVNQNGIDYSLKSNVYAPGVGVKTGTLHNDSGSAARFFYCAKASKKDREGSNHPTMKPTDLMRYLCRLITPPGGLILDPFMGSGSTGKAALLEGFQFVGIELDADYHAIAERRVKI